MFKLACPGCGAEVAFRSATSAIAVCTYCRATLLREADAVRDVGRMAEVLEDYSPIRITTSGVYAGKAFGVVGRIQLRYDGGFWNEWYILFDDGTAGWLSDASGQYALTEDSGPASDAPPFAQIVPGGGYLHDGQTFTAADLRSARCTGGEGELPFPVGAGWEAKVADYRQGRRFLTLDYSEGSPPRRYVGKLVTLADMKCQLLRDGDDIQRSAGHLKGKAATLDCPGCGAPIPWHPGMAAHLRCPACGTASDATTGVAEVLRISREQAAVSTTLALGDSATIDGQAWTLIGLMKCRESGSSDEWVEYLLFSETAGFLWLVESSQGWDKLRVVNDDWPQLMAGSAVRLGDEYYTRLISYGAEVSYVAGAFNWKVQVGDKVSITDYRGTLGTLSSERNAAEITWSLATRVPAATVDAWFGKGGALTPDAPLARLLTPDIAARRSALRPLAAGYSALVLILNLPLALSGGLYCWITTLIAIATLWLPVFTNAFSDD